ncbi:MAG TPA: hypothetical protein ACFYEF_03010 [Candidatus Wunengus sp. YC63]|uniref:hypothetical protein n=1 Tax=unclassified Candidatus Wunengus TaxID=3367695 RepID=UPI0040268110
MIYFTVTIDVEPDCSPSWHYSDPLTFYGVSIGIKEKLQPLFNKYGIRPTYLINNVVIEDGKSVETLAALEGNFELGTHLHPEFIEPKKQFYDYAGKKAEANQCALDPRIEFLKLQNITELFTKKFGYCPASFRAGRFSAGPNTIKSLELLGYKVDTSVTPHVKWNDATREMPVDFTRAGEQPYFIKKNSIIDKDIRGNILEVPVSIIQKNTFFGKKNIWLRPSHSTFKDFLSLVNIFHEKYSHEGNYVLNMMFHNVEVIPNKSPYTKNDKDCRIFLNTLENFLAHCKNNNIKSVTLTQLYDIYRHKR